MLVGIASTLSFYGFSLDVTEAQTTIPVVAVVKPEVDTTLYPTQTFSWKGPVGASNVEFHVSLGSTLGGSNYFNRYLGPGVTSVTITNIPQQEGKAYLRIWSKVQGSWSFADFVYNTGPVADAGENLYVEPIKSNTSAVSLGDAYVATFIPYADQIRYEDTTSGGATTITSIVPASGTTVSSAQRFSWNMVSGATEYWVEASQVRVGGKELYDATTGTQPAVTLTVPQNGKTLYVRIWYKVGSTWKYADASYVVGGAVGTITEIAPDINSKLASQVTFAWNTVSGALEYWLDVGTRPFSSTVTTGSIYSRSVTNTSAVVSGIPQTGNDVYVRVWYMLGTKMQPDWRYRDFRYETNNSSIVSDVVTIVPAAGTVLTSANQLFSWAPVQGAAEYWIEASQIAAGKNELYNKTNGTATKVQFSVPQNGKALYLTIWYRVAGVWKSSVFTYKTANSSTYSAIQTINPAPGDSITTSQVFSWNAVIGASRYGIEVSQVSLGASELAYKVVTAPSVTLTNINTGKNLYLRIWYEVAGVWKSQDFTYYK